MMQAGVPLPPVAYSFSTEGTKSLYAWIKDAAGNVSASVSAQVVITLPDIFITEDIIICEGGSYEGWTTQDSTSVY